jgi:amino acid transporter
MFMEGETPITKANGGTGDETEPIVPPSSPISTFSTRRWKETWTNLVGERFSSFFRGTDNIATAASVIPTKSPSSASLLDSSHDQGGDGRMIESAYAESECEYGNDDDYMNVSIGSTSNSGNNSCSDNEQEHYWIEGDAIEGEEDVEKVHVCRTGNGGGRGFGFGLFGIGSSENGGGSRGNEDNRKMGTLHLTLVAYFLICGGPFSIEEAVGAAGPLPSIIGLLVLPWLWSVPQAIMAAELSLMTSQNGGNILWVQQAFGDFLGWVNAFNIVSANIANIAMYPVLFVEYISIKFGWWEEMGIKLGFIAAVIIVNIIGLDFMGKLSLLMLLVIMFPFVAEVVIGPAEGYLEWVTLSDSKSISDIDWALFLSVVIWNIDGFDMTGAMAGEVKGGRSTFIKGIVFCMPLISISYLILIIGYWVLPDYSHWTAGTFYDVGKKLAAWVGVWITVGSAISTFGLAIALTASVSRSCWAMAKEEGKSQKLPSIVGWSFRMIGGEEVPLASLITVGLISAALTGIPFGQLIEVTTILRIVNVLLQYAALIRLRFREPDTPRPFMVPGGKLGTILLALPSVALAGFLLATAGWKMLVIGASGNAIFVGGYLLHSMVWKWRTKKYNELRKDTLAET